MAQALPSGTTVHRRRVMFGALDADGWGWATVKAFFWFLVLILLLAYIPDRAYYFTVGRTVELGLPLWTPINFCPAENKTLDCPAPAGAVVPWENAPAQLALPAPRTNGAAAQVGSDLLYIGGSDGNAPTASTFVTTVKNGDFGAWNNGPALPAARADAAVAVANGVAYVIGGTGPDGKATDTVWSIGLDQQTSKLGQWTVVKDVTLPEARTGAAATAVSDGVLVAGGLDPSGKPSATVWKATFAKDGSLGKFEAQRSLVDPIAHAAAALVGTNVWVYGGTDANGASGAVQRGEIGIPAATGAGASTAPAASAATTAPQAILRWGVSAASNLPAARTGGAGFSSNGTLYLVGGSDGTNAQPQLFWAIPSDNGDLSGWKHLKQTDLPSGITGASAIASGSTAFVIGGKTDSGVLRTPIRASLAPQEPFFRLGLVGAEVPALKLEGEIGQQLGYLNAAGAGTVDFVLLLLIGWAFAHRPQIRAWVDRRRAARVAR